MESESFPFRLEKLRSLKEALDQVLSEEGKVVWLYDTRKVLVQDRPENFEMIRAVMEEYAPRSASIGPMVRVEFFFDENRSGVDSGLGVQGQVEIGGVRIGNDPRGNNGVDVRARNNHITRSISQSSFLMVQSGNWSRLNITREVARPVVFRQYLSRHGWISNEIVAEWQQVGTLLEVAPEVRGQLIELELTPVITAFENGKRMNLRVRELLTRVTVASGVRVEIGGFENADDGFHRQFFGVDRNQETTAVHFAVRATVMGATP